ncbi:hypothetical protein Golob_027725, partial [Gossypium lobatum]|nr:hypothetical protein [Gossypium lobatum]
MIIEAIGALKEKNGSSKRAISKYIELAHKPYPPSHDELLTQHLKLLKSSGQLVMILLLLLSPTVLCLQNVVAGVLLRLIRRFRLLIPGLS